MGLIGWSGSGKTHLLTRLLPLFIARGLTVSTVKHAHHGFDLDQPGKDSFAHRAAGAREVMIGSASRWALMHELSDADREPELETLLARMSPVDLVLVEGFKASPHPKIEVHRPSLGLAPFWPQRADIAAVASDLALADCPLPQLDLAAPEQIVSWSLQFLTMNDALQPET
jgi:molybdopterin-guanine dinucleotide biosynthesis protein MobB